MQIIDHYTLYYINILIYILIYINIYIYIYIEVYCEVYILAATYAFHLCAGSCPFERRGRSITPWWEQLAREKEVCLPKL